MYKVVYRVTQQSNASCSIAEVEEFQRRMKGLYRSEDSATNEY